MCEDEYGLDDGASLQFTKRRVRDKLESQTNVDGIRQCHRDSSLSRCDQCNGLQGSKGAVFPVGHSTAPWLV
eukprot:4908710-Amphidinium_carterae.1